MAFEYFARKKVDFAVVEVGLGGRLDTTNIITPVLSVITNVALDHTALLGNTIAEIAREKAGIIKPGVPAVIGRRNPESDPIFCAASSASVIFAPDKPLFKEIERADDMLLYKGTAFGDIESPLSGDVQPENMQTVLTAVSVLNTLPDVSLRADVIRLGLADVCRSTGLMGRWTVLRKNPKVIIDTAHNPDGWRGISERLGCIPSEGLHIVIGFASDKDYESILSTLPREANYYFVTLSTPRGANAETICRIADKFNIRGEAFPTVYEGYEAALQKASEQQSSGLDPLVFVGGSNFAVADLLQSLGK